MASRNGEAGLAGWPAATGERLRQGWPYLVAAGLVTALTLAVFWYAGHAFLLLGAGILVAVLLGAASDGIASLTGLSRRLGLAIACLAILGALVGIGLTAAPGIASQVRDLSGQLEQTWDRLHQFLDSFAWGRKALEQAQSGAGGGGGAPSGLQQAAQSAFAAASATIGGVGNLVIILIVGVYLAVEPGLYLRGIVKLFPLPRRPRIAEVLDEVAHTLRAWLTGQLIAMAVIAVVSGVGLWLLGIPFALLLALIAGLTNFIPNIGPLIGLTPALLVAFGVSPWHPLYVFLLYCLVQSIESYLLTPRIQRRAVDLPEVVTIMAQVVLGLLGGVLGLLLATPMAAAGLVLVRRLYLEDVLGDREA